MRNFKSSKPKEYWNILNKATNTVEKSGDISLEVFSRYFERLSAKPEDVNAAIAAEFDPTTIRHSTNEYINKEFTEEEVMNMIVKLRNNKACGVDNIINEYLKKCPEMLVSIIVKMFNVVLSSGLVPSVWCIGMIKPLYIKKKLMIQTIIEGSHF